MNKLLFAFLLVTTFCFSQNTQQIPIKKTQKGFAVLDFLSVDMPSDGVIESEDHMLLSGTHYNLIFDNFYTGLGIYGALRGDRGGFFTLGLNAGYKAFLTNRLFIDSGLHFGGGGGAGALDGGGAFILPHFNIGFDFKDFSIQSGYSYINFFDGGKIKSHQVHLAIQVPLNFEYTDFSNAELEFDLDQLNQTTWDKKFKRFSFMLHLNNLLAKGRTTGEFGLSLKGTTIRLAGFEMSAYTNSDWFFFIKTDGAFDGIKAGYMDVFLGAGKLISLNKNKTNFLAKFGLGAGGGGGVNTQGGILIYPDISLEQFLFDNIYLSLNTGFVMSPNSKFYTQSYGLGLKYYSNMNGTQPSKNLKKSKFKGFEFILKQDFYHRAERITNPIEDLYQIAFQLNYYLNKNLYAAGQTAFANFGNAGAYAEGIVGLGLKTNPFFDNKFSFFTQFLIGGAGGGNISTGEGLIIKPSAGFYYDLSNSLSVRLAGGYVKSKGGALSSYTANVGISYKLAFLNSK